MAQLNQMPWDVGAVLVCSKCGTKFNQPQLAEEVKSEMRRYQKEQQTQTQIRVIVSGCLGVCYPEKQTLSFMPVEGKTELFTTELNKEAVVQDIKDLIQKKIIAK